jgi:hypothetical protein
MIGEILEKIRLHQKRATSSMNEICEWESIDSNIFEDFEKVKTVDTFIYRFIKMQDLIGDKLFRVFLDAIGEYKDNMSLLDVLDKLEKLEIIPDSQEWMIYRKLRNKLTHEYPNNEDEIIEGIKVSMEVFSDIETILTNIESYKNSHKLL